MNPKNVVTGLFGTATSLVKLPLTVGEQVLHRLHPGDKADDKAAQPTTPVAKTAEKAETVAVAAAETVRARAATAKGATKDKGAAAKDKVTSAQKSVEKSAKKAAKGAKKAADKQPEVAADEPQTVLLVDTPPTELPPPVDVVGEALATEATAPEQPAAEPATLPTDDKVVHTSGS